MKKHKNQILFIEVSIVLISSLLAGCSGSTAKTTSNIKQGGEMITASAVFDSYVLNVQDGIRPKPSTPSVSREEAERQTGIKVLLPDCEEITGELLGIYVDTSASGNKEVCLHFSDGILLTEEVWKDKLDFNGKVQEEKKARAECTNVIAGEPSVVSVAGNAGEFMTEYTFRGRDNLLCGLPAQLEWWEGGVKYFMTSWKLGFTKSQLLKIANSMYE